MACWTSQVKAIVKAYKGTPSDFLDVMQILSAPDVNIETRPDEMIQNYETTVWLVENGTFYQSLFRGSTVRFMRRSPSTKTKRPPSNSDP